MSEKKNLELHFYPTTDVDECKLGHKCGQNNVCINTVGSFSCECIKGFKRSKFDDSCIGKSKFLIIKSIIYKFFI